MEAIRLLSPASAGQATGLSPQPTARRATQGNVVIRIFPRGILDRIVLDHTDVDHTGLDCTDVDCTGLVRTGLDRMVRGRIVLKRILPVAALLAIISCFCGCTSVPEASKPGRAAPAEQPSRDILKAEKAPATGDKDVPSRRETPPQRAKPDPSPPDPKEPTLTAGSAAGPAPAEQKRGTPPSEAPSFQQLAEGLASPQPAERVKALERVTSGDREGRIQAAVQAALRDQDLSARLAAVAALGRIGGASAQQELRRLAEAEGEVFRAAAASSLVRLGDKEALRRAASDRSPYVRRAAARLLAEVPPRESPDDPVWAAAWRLIRDSSGDVQVETLRAIAQWPGRQAAPLLFEGLGSHVYAARHLAHEQLSSQWPPAREFPWQADPAASAAEWEALREAFARSHPADGKRAPSDTAHPIQPGRATNVAGEQP